MPVTGAQVARFEMKIKPPVFYKPTPDSELWKVVLFDKLATDFDLVEPLLPEFHEMAKDMPGWDYVRSRYGIVRKSPPETDPRFTETWTPYRIARDESIWPMTEGWVTSHRSKMVHTYINDIMLVWGRRADKAAKERQRQEFDELLGGGGATIGMGPVAQVTREQRRRVPTAEAAPRLPIALPSAHEDDEKLLRQYGFGPATFGHAGRDEQEAMVERAWFVSRLRDTKRLFDEPSISSIARGALLSEMYLRRIDAHICLAESNTKEFEDLQRTRQKIEMDYREAQKQMNEAVPWASEVANKVRVQGVLSNWMDGLRDAIANGDNTLLDGLYTAYEVQVLLRESLQHEMRYRAGQAAAIHEAIAGLWNPNFIRLLPDLTCRMMDEGFKEGAKRVREERGLQVPDLENEGPSGEYPPLIDPKEDPDAMEPSVNVPVA